MTKKEELKARLAAIRENAADFGAHNRYHPETPLTKEVPFGKDRRTRKQKNNDVIGRVGAGMDYVMSDKKVRPDKPKQKDFSRIISAKMDRAYSRIVAAKLEEARGRVQEIKIAKEHAHQFVVSYQNKLVKTAQLVPSENKKYLKYWLLNAKQVNGNGWGVDPSTIDKNIMNFEGMPFVVTAQEWHGQSPYLNQYVHPYIPTNNLRQIFAHQERFRVGTIRRIIKDADQNYYAQIEKLPKFAHMVDPPFCSPGIFQLDPRENQQHLSKWLPLHLAGLMEDPAYGPYIATLKGSCVGTENECHVQFSQQKYAQLNEFECPYCDKTFETKSLKINHVAKEHGSDTSKTAQVICPLQLKSRLQRIAFQRPFRKFFIHTGDEGEEDVNDYDPHFNRGKLSGYGVSYSHPQHLKREYGEKIKSFKDMDEALTRHNLVRAIDEDVNGTKTRTLHIGSNPSKEQIETVKNQFQNSPHPVRAEAPSISRKYHKDFNSFQKHLEGLQGKTPEDIGNKAFKTHTQELSARLQKIASELGEENMTYQGSKKVKLKKKLTKIAREFYEPKEPEKESPLRKRFMQVKEHMEKNPDINLPPDQISDYIKSGKPFNPSKTARYNVQNPEEVQINPQHGAAIAEAYGQMKHDPKNPEVKGAYDALINETKQQYKGLISGGLKVTPSNDQYKNSKEMHEDIEKNNHLRYFPTQSGGDLPRDHPMAQPTDIKDPNGKPMMANDVFRIVHDVNGHHLAGKSGFGPRGEHQAYLQHSKMYSPLAKKALFTETAGQNNYVNFGPNGEHNRKDPANTIYAPQKAGLMPDTVINGKHHQV